MYTLANTYHNTTTKTKYSPDERERINEDIYNGDATDAEIQARRRARRALCGITGCTCGNDWGERG